MQRSDRSEKKLNPLKQEFKELLSVPNESQGYDSAMRALNLADGLGAIAKRRGDSKVFYSMKTKLQLLENLY